MTARLASMALLCCFVSVASPSGASAAEASPSEPTEPLTAQLEQLERMWQDGEHSQYFIRADEIIKRLPYEPTEEAQPAGLKLLGAMLAKNIPSPDDDWKQALNVGSADIRTMTMLGRFLAGSAEVSIDLRQQKVRLLATLLGRLRGERIPGYVPERVSLNVRLPPGVRGVAGMSPDAIEDPVAREQYRAAIRENSLKGLRYKRQRALEDAEKIVARPIVEHLSHAATSDGAVANAVASSWALARLTESEKKEVFEKRSD
jgi:hypothetical protein